MNVSTYIWSFLCVWCCGPPHVITSLLSGLWPNKMLVIPVLIGVCATGASNPLTPTNSPLVETHKWMQRTGQIHAIFLLSCVYLNDVYNVFLHDTDESHKPKRIVQKKVFFFSCHTHTLFFPSLCTLWVGEVAPDTNLYMKTVDEETIQSQLYTVHTCKTF